MALTRPFTTTSQINAVYTYSDVADGTGVLVFQGFTHKEDTTLGYALSQTAMYPNDLYTKGTTTSASFTKILDLDFELSSFNLPRTLKGIARCEATLGAGIAATSNATGSVYAILKIRKWDGTTETEIANAQSETHVNGTNLAIEWKTVNFEVNISSQTQFTVGDQLRLTMEIWGKRTSGGGNNTEVYLLHDPINRTDATSIPQDEGGVPVKSTLKFHVPFKLDV